MYKLLQENLYKLLINPQVEPVCTFPAYLFNEKRHLIQQPCEKLFTLYWYHHKKAKADARFSFFVKDGIAISPCRATFGSIELSSSLPVQHLHAFIEAIDDFAVYHKIKQMYITHYPTCYAPATSALLTASLLHKGYQIKLAELNYHITVQNSISFEESLHLSEKRKLKKCLEKGFTFGEELQPDLISVYEFIKASRVRQGFPVSLDVGSFQQMFTHFPGVYQIFTVKDRGTIIALTVTVRINGNILYNFYPSDAPAYRSFSPAVLLTKGIYKYCQQNGFSIFDLGIATDKGKPNYGLIRFKQFLGGEPSVKYSFIKMYASE